MLGDVSGDEPTPDSSEPFDSGMNLADGVYFDRPGVAVVRWNTAIKAVHIEWQGWADSWFPGVVAAGLRRMALVIPKSGVCQDEPRRHGRKGAEHQA
jgi:hypothetical protein